MPTPRSGTPAGHPTTVPLLPTGDELVCELHRLGLQYLNCGRTTRPVQIRPEVLLIGLATSPEARLRAALVPLFLWRSDYAAVARGAAARLSGRDRVTLVCCYSAAVALQMLHADRLTHLGNPCRRLPDLFAADLDLPTPEDPSTRLAAVAARHAQLSGEDINWLGTYRHAVAGFLRSSTNVSCRYQRSTRMPST